MIHYCCLAAPQSDYRVEAKGGLDLTHFSYSLKCMPGPESSWKVSFLDSFLRLLSRTEADLKRAFLIKKSSVLGKKMVHIISCCINLYCTVLYCPISFVLCT